VVTVARQQRAATSSAGNTPAAMVGFHADDDVHGSNCTDAISRP
jgi:hypothetical protein